MEGAGPEITEEIKLVVWDLDETFWNGTLSEGAIDFVEQHVAAVQELTGRGIVNSICSKNDFDQAKSVLAGAGVWDYFIFPKIDWLPKGEMLKKTLEEAQLRPCNALFIDDNTWNLQEAKFYLPELHVAGPDSIPLLLGHERLRGKPDPLHTRLKQYKVLERRFEGRKYCSSNIEFLESSHIRVRLVHDCAPHLERICDLIGRANQLNYTKRRVTFEEVQALVDDPAITTGCVEVCDDFGDYGIVGFCAVQGEEVLHFVFSCRVLNLGVEQWVHAQLGFKKVEIVGAVATQLDTCTVPSWINRDSSCAPREVKREVPAGTTRCLLRGGCDLEQVAHYLKYASLAVDTEFNYSKGGISIHREHTEILRSAFSLTGEQRSFLAARLPFYDGGVFETGIFDASYDVVVVSVLMDYTQSLYRLKGEDRVVVAYGDFLLPMTVEDHWPYYLQSFTVDFLRWFREHFEHLGALSVARFQENLAWLRDRLPPRTLLLLINGSEVPLQHEFEKERWAHHAMMNRALEAFVEGAENTRLVDVRGSVLAPEDVMDNIRHYQRVHYRSIASQVTAAIRDSFGGLGVADRMRYGIRSALTGARNVMRSQR